MNNHYKKYEDQQPKSPALAAFLLVILTVVVLCFSFRSCAKSIGSDSLKQQYSRLDSAYKHEQALRIAYQVQLAVQTQKDSTNKYRYAFEFAKGWQKQEKRYIDRDKKYNQIIAILTSVVLYLKIKN